MSAETETRQPGRRVHWLELFFDLVLVAYIGQIAHTMHGDPSWTDAAVFFALLATAWWAWVNAMVSMNIFGARVTPVIWVAVTVAMISIGVMAAAVPEALTERATAFALANVVIRLVWAIPWFMKRRSSGLPWWRPVLYCLVPASLWAVSIAFDTPARLALWGAAILLEIVLLSFLGTQTAWLRRVLDVDHLIERVTLVVVIVFGESVLSIVAQLSEHWTLDAGITAVLALIAVALLAWLFFGRATSAVERGLHNLQMRGSVGGLRDTIMYLPFLLVGGVVLFASALGTAVAEAGHPLAIGAAVSLSAGVSLYFVASAAESLRYGAPWRDVVLWGPLGVLLPWVYVPVASVLTAGGVVVVVVLTIAILLGVTELNVARMRQRGAVAPPAGSQ